MSHSAMGDARLSWRRKPCSEIAVPSNLLERSPPLTPKAVRLIKQSRLRNARHCSREKKARAILQIKSMRKPTFTGAKLRFEIPVCEMRNKISGRWITVGICAGLIALIWFVFGQTRSFPFINFDDPEYVYEVPEINSGLSWHNVGWAFTHRPSTNWFPLKNISHMFEFQFFGPNPGAFHLTNVILHAIAALLLFLLLCRMTRCVWCSAFVAAIFAIHPLRAESVVWIEERKDVLSGVFFMFTLLSYLYYTRKPSIPRYVTMSILFAAGLLSKPMLVTTPLVLLLLDYWPLVRSHMSHVTGHTSQIRYTWPKLIIEKIPLFVLAAAASFMSAGGIASAHNAADQLPFLARIGNAIVSYFVYIWQMIWPANLGVFYPYPRNGYPFWEIAIAAAILLAITI